MYIVEWCDKEGNLCEMEFSKLRDAKAERKGLTQRFDGVQIKKITPLGHKNRRQ